MKTDNLTKAAQGAADVTSALHQAYLDAIDERNEFAVLHLRELHLEAIALRNRLDSALYAANATNE